MARLLRQGLLLRMRCPVTYWDHFHPESTSLAFSTFFRVPLSGLGHPPAHGHLSSYSKTTYFTGSHGLSAFITFGSIETLSASAGGGLGTHPSTRMRWISNGPPS